MSDVPVAQCVKLMQHNGLGVAMVQNLTPCLSPAAEPSGSQTDTDSALARGRHHIAALHALSALLTADASSTLGSRVQSSGALAAVLESLGSQTEQRLLAPAQFQLQNFRLVEAHIVFLEVRLSP